jgi:glycine betaine/proline transport system ATP-binding protein
VVDKDNKFIGFITDDVAAKLQKDDVKDIREHIVKDVPMVAPDTSVADLLPLYLDYSLPIAVVNEDYNLKGLVVHSSVIAEMIGVEQKDVIQLKEDGGINND